MCPGEPAGKAGESFGPKDECGNERVWVRSAVGNEEVGVGAHAEISCGECISCSAFTEGNEEAVCGRPCVTGFGDRKAVSEEGGDRFGGGDRSVFVAEEGGSPAPVGAGGAGVEAAVEEVVVGAGVEGDVEGAAADDFEVFDAGDEAFAIGNQGAGVGDWGDR